MFYVTMEKLPLIRLGPIKNKMQNDLGMLNMRNSTSALLSYSGMVLCFISFPKM